MKSLACFITGMLAGMLLMYFIQGHQLESIYWEKENLKVQLYEKTEQLRTVQEQQQAMIPATVKEIELEIEMEKNNFVEPALKKQVYELVKGTLGQEILALPHPMLINLLENRVVEAEGKDYRLDVEAVIIGETLTYYLTAEKLDGDDA